MADQFEGRVYNDFGMVNLQDMKELLWHRVKPEDYEEPRKGWVPEDPKCRFEWEGPAHMPKMRMFKFWNEAGDEKEKEAMSLKKAVMSVQNDFKDKIIGVEYTSKKGKSIETSVRIPMGRKIRQSIIAEQKRAAAEAARERR